MINRSRSNCRDFRKPVIESPDVNGQQVNGTSYETGIRSALFEEETVVAIGISILFVVTRKYSVQAQRRVAFYCMHRSFVAVHGIA
jgi:hypothetical protein